LKRDGLKGKQVATANINLQSGKEALLHLLRDTRERFLGSFAGLSDADSRRKPSDSSWCVLETVEHLTKAEGNMVRLITETRRPKSQDLPNREQAFLRMVPDRSMKMQSPESGRPTGQFASLVAAAAQFNSSRDQAIQFVEQCADCGEDLRATEVTHPHPMAGNVSCYEMVIIMAQHAERHALQIEEIKNTLGITAGKAAGSQG
jgi:hypothetical protein